LQPASAALLTAAPPPSPAAPETPARRPRPLLSWTAALGTLVVMILLARTLVAYPLLPLRIGHPSVPADTSQQSNDTFSAPDVQFTAVSMSSPRSGWAVGYRNGGGQSGAFGPLLLRYDGRGWISTPSPDNQQFFGVLAVSDDEAWATAADGI